MSENELAERIGRMEDEVCRRRPVMADLLQRHGRESLHAYTERFSGFAVDPVQPRDDLVDVAVGLAGELLGEDVAARLRTRLDARPLILTANHHGPDFLNLTVQGSVLFALPEPPDSVVPVMAFGGVPLNNLSWGRGIRLSDGRRLNLFPERLKASMVGVTPPFDAEMVGRTAARLDGECPPAEQEALREILEAGYLDAGVLGEPTYSRQATRLNGWLWDRIFRTAAMPSMVYLEIEAVVAALLGRDLRSDDSVMARVIGDPAVRQAALNALDGLYGCWDRGRLKALQDVSLDGPSRREKAGSAGTAFFWGVDARGRRIPLWLDDGVFRGVDDSGGAFMLGCETDAILQALADRRIYPSLFTVFAAVALARGFRCYGGFFQADYLTAMRRGLCAALRSVGETEWSERMALVPTENYVTGLIFAVTEDAAGARPSGAVDMIAGAGLTDEALARVRNEITVEKASLMGLPEVYRMVCHDSLDPVLSGITPEQLSAHASEALIRLGRRGRL